MKKALYLFLVTLLWGQSPVAKAQEATAFQHLGIGLSAGTDGLGLEVSSPLTHYLQARAGFHFLPQRAYYRGEVKYRSALQHPDDHSIAFEVGVNMRDWKFLLDFYPLRHSSFRFTTGFYWGDRTLIMGKSAPHAALRNGGYILVGNTPFGGNKEGIAPVEIRTAPFKPYLGIGFGRAVPSKSRLTVAFDLGLRFMGSPRLYAWSQDKLRYGFHEVRPEEIALDEDSRQVRDALKTLHGVQLYPVMSLRLCGRLF